MKLKSTALTLAVTLACSTSALADQVKPAWSGIDHELFQTYVVAEGLKDLGYDVAEPTPVQINLAHTAVASGDLDFYPIHWVPLHDAFWSEAGGDENLMRTGTIAKDSLQGYMIDKKTADETGIKYLEDLRDPERAKLFDIDGNGKADLYGCDPGWGCERVIEHHLDAYDLRDTVEHKQGGYFAIIPDAVKRVQSGKPTLYYTWTPHWLSSTLVPGKDVVWLNVHESTLPDGQTGDTVVEDLGNLGFPVNDQKIIANTEFLNENPVAKKFFELVQIPIADLNAENNWIVEGANSNEEIHERAMAWIAEHQEEWDAWIAEAKAAE